MDYNWEDWKDHSKQDIHSINKDPLFIDQANGNFRLKASSSCMNTGENIGLKGVDYYGNPIPYGNFDIGVYELQAGKDTTPSLLK